MHHNGQPRPSRLRVHRNEPRRFHRRLLLVLHRGRASQPTLGVTSPSPPPTAALPVRPVGRGPSRPPTRSSSQSLHSCRFWGNAAVPQHTAAGLGSSAGSSRFSSPGRTTRTSPLASATNSRPSGSHASCAGAWMPRATISTAKESPSAVFTSASTRSELERGVASRNEAAKVVDLLDSYCTVSGSVRTLSIPRACGSVRTLSIPRASTLTNAIV